MALVAPDRTLAWFTEQGGSPRVAEALVASYRAIWQHAFDPRLLELVRLRVAQLVRCADELAERTPEAVAAGVDDATVAALASWPTHPAFDERDRTVLGWVEQWVLDVQGITDEHARSVQALFSEHDLAQLTLALSLFETVIRARAALAA